MGNGEKSSLRNFHLHLPHLHLHLHHHHPTARNHAIRDVPKGCMALRVGPRGEAQERFVVPVMYCNHPLFLRLLKVAEEEYGFDRDGPISIPCHVEEFRKIKSVIDGEIDVPHRQHSQAHGHVIGCFRV